jgi:Ca2+-binding RTX toxin-like protein
MSIVTQGTTDGDELIGTIGSDDLNGGNGDDIVRGGAGDDTVRGGNGDDDVNGGSGDDDVRGGFGDDTVKGGEGDDTVNGGRDDDVLAGGRGADTFVFDGVWGADAGEDIVIDYEDGVDLLSVLNVDSVMISDTAEGALLSMSTGGSLTLEGVTAAEIDASDFTGAVPELIFV